MEEKPILEKVNEMYETFESGKDRNFRAPRKAKINKRKLKKGYSVILRVDDNGNVDFEKQQIKDSTFRLKGGTFHSTKKSSILSYKGKPFIIQPTKRLNPCNPLIGKNQTYGQKYIMGRMMFDSLKIKQKAGNILIWLLLAGVGIFVISKFFGGG